jgi:hypothetical protein
MPFDKVGIDINAQPGAGGNLDFSANHLQGRSLALKRDIGAESFELMVGAGIGRASW